MSILIVILNSYPVVMSYSFHFSSEQFVPDTSATPLLLEVILLNERSEVLFESVATRTRQSDHVAHCDPAVFASEFDNLQ